MNNMNKIDDLFREAMTGYKMTPAPGLWLRIERHFFPPSKYRPSGLITSVLLLSIAGLMPWILIPANDQDEKKPVLPEGNFKRGYLIETITPVEIKPDGNGDYRISARSFTVRPTVYEEKEAIPEADASEQFIASINDPADDPAIRPILIANRQHIADLAEPAIPVAAVKEGLLKDASIAFLESHPVGLMQYSRYIEEMKISAELRKTSLTPYHEKSYVRKGEFSAGLNFNPSIVFYDPNPYNKMLGGDATISYKMFSFSIMTGIGYSRMEDVSTYKVDYMTNDSVGYFIRVIGFIPDPRNPGEITYITRQEAIYDSVPHYTIEDKTNYYSYIDIPFSVGYTLLQTHRISLTIDAGIKFSLLVDRDEPDIDFRISDAELINVERQVPARLNTNWRFTAGVDFGYILSDRFSLHLEPVFEQYISPVYAKQPGYLPRKPYVTGVKAGIRYNF